MEEKRMLTITKTDGTKEQVEEVISFEFNDTKKNELFSLVNSDINFYTGLCLPNECSALLSKGFNQSIISNSLLQTYFNEFLNIKSMKYVAKDDKNNIETRYSSHNTYFLLVGIPILIYLAIQVISAIVLELFIKSSEDKIKQVKLESEKKETRKRSQSRKRASPTKSVPKNENNDARIKISFDCNIIQWILED